MADIEKLQAKWAKMSMEELLAQANELEQEAAEVRERRVALRQVIDTKAERRRLAALTGYSEGALAILTDEQIRALVEQTRKDEAPEGSVTAEVGMLAMNTGVEPVSEED